MSQSRALEALAGGPLTALQLVKATGVPSGQIGRLMSELMSKQAVKRIDGRAGRGTKAVYAATATGHQLAVAPRPPEWTDERVAILTKDWNNGVLPKETAAKLGVSRNTVVGKAHRLGLGLREAPRRAVASAPRAITVPHVVEFEPVATVPAFKVAKGRVYLAMDDATAKPVRKIAGATTASRLLPIIYPDFGGCKWPVSGEGADTLFCCAPKPHGEVYCRPHYQRSVARPLTDAEKAENKAKADRAQAAGGFRFNGGRAA